MEALLANDEIKPSDVYQYVVYVYYMLGFMFAMIIGKVILHIFTWIDSRDSRRESRETKLMVKAAMEEQHEINQAVHEMTKSERTMIDTVVRRVISEMKETQTVVKEAQEAVKTATDKIAESESGKNLAPKLPPL